MDRDIYLILIGAGISLASSIVTLILQFLLDRWNENLRAKRAGKERHSKEIRMALLDRSAPTSLKHGRLIGRERSDDDDHSGLDIPQFLRRRSQHAASPTNSRLLTPAKKFWAQYLMPITIGILVFISWIVYIWISKASGNPL
jgi:hypothetical protein